MRKKAKILGYIVGSTALVTSITTGVVAQACGSGNNIPSVNPNLAIIETAVQALNNYNGQTFQQGSLVESILNAVNLRINILAPGENLTNLSFQTPSDPIQNGNIFTVSAVINTASTSGRNVVGGTLEITFAEMEQIITVSSVFGIIVTDRMTALTTLFNELNGFVLGQRPTTTNEDTILDVLANQLNNLNVGIINPNNTPNSTYNTLVDGTSLNLGTVELSPSGSAANAFNATLSDLSVTAGNIATDTTPQYEGIQTQFEGAGVIITFTFVNGIITVPTISGGTITHVPPVLNFSETDFTTRLLNEIYNSFTNAGATDNNLIFNSLINSNVVSRSNLSTWSFVNTLSNYGGLQSLSISGNILTRANSQNNFTISSYDQTANSAVITINSSFFITNTAVSSWESNISGDENRLVFSDNISLNVIALGTTESPIFIFSPSAGFNYFSGQIASAVNIFTLGLATVGTFSPLISEITNTITSAIGQNLLNPVIFTSGITPQNVNVSGVTYTFSLTIADGQIAIDGRTLTGTPTFAAMLSNGVLSINSVMGISLV